MIRVGITGQSGFIGTHLYNIVGLLKDEFVRIPFEDDYFKDEKKLRGFVRECDVVIHLAAMNRYPDPQIIYQTNICLVEQLIEAMEAERVSPHVLFSSSVQEESDNEYGHSKRKGRTLLEEWAQRNGASFTGMVLPNVFGPFGKPNYNSFVVTFCYKLTHGEIPQVLQDNEVKLIYIGNLCKHIIDKIKQVNNSDIPIVDKDIVPYDFDKKVTEVLSVLENFKNLYFNQGVIPG